MEANKILIVEDNRHIRLAMVTFLKMKGFEVEEAEALQSAKQALDNGSISAVITDLNLPDGKGDELLQKTTAPVIAMTGQVDEATRRHVHDIGFSGFLSKPATLDQVLEALQKVIKPS